MNGKRLSPKKLDELRTQAVALRLQKKSLNEVQELIGLSHPTIIQAYKSFLQGGWNAVKVETRGRPKGSVLGQSETLKCIELLINPPTVCIADKQQLWSNEIFLSYIQETLQLNVSAKTVGRYLQQWGFSPDTPIPVNKTPLQWLKQQYPIQTLRKDQAKIFIGGISELNIATDPQQKTATGRIVYARDLRGKLQWLASTTETDSILLINFLQRLRQQYHNDNIQLYFKSYPLTNYPDIQQWLSNQNTFQLISLIHKQSLHRRMSGGDETQSTPKITYVNQSYVRNTMALTHLQRLEAESIQIMREVAAETENPVMLYSIGKDSAVMLHLAMKAFYPSKPPFPLLHVDTGWKFREMYAFRDQLVKDLGMELITYMNPEGVEKNINPFTHGSALHTDIMKTEGLKQALNKYGFDAAFGGARRDEEKSRAKERVFSFRTSDHRWDPKNQRPELWKHYNAKKRQGESIRVFPLSNWTELDIWQYIHLENIPIVPLYLSAERPVVERDGMLIMVDDERMPLNEGEVPMMKNVRFRTLGCYPLTGAVESDADTLPSIIQEMLLTKSSERQGRLIDHDSTASMEKKKQEGYF